MDHDVPAFRAGLFRAQDSTFSFPFRDGQRLVRRIGNDDAAIGRPEHGQIVRCVAERDRPDRLDRAALVMGDDLRHALGLGCLRHQGEEASALNRREAFRLEQVDEGALLVVSAGKAARL